MSGGYRLGGNESYELDGSECHGVSGRKEPKLVEREGLRMSGKV